MTYTSEIEKLERRWSENPKGRNFAPLADAYRKAGELDRAIELCTAGLERHPDYVSAHIVFGRCLMDQKNDAGAAHVFRKVLALDPENVLALKILGEIALRGGRSDEAVDWLTRLLAADPMNGEAAEMLTRAKGKAAQQAAPAPAPAAPARAAEPVVQFVPEPAAPRPASAPATVRTAAPAPGPAGRAPAPAPPRSPTPPAPPPPPPPPPPARPAAKADLVVEHTSDQTAPRGPGAPSALPEIEAFDGVVDFNAVAHDAAKAEGLEVQKEVELKPQDLVVEGLAHTQYESAFAPPPEASEPEDELSTIELPLIMPDDDPEGTALPAAFRPAAPEWSAPRPLAAASPPTPAPPPVAPPAPPPAAVALSDDDGAADTAALSRAEPVLTETMAELYLRQGHEENALRVYQALLAQRPGDARLRARVAELTSGSTRQRDFAGDRGRGTGESVQTFLRRILAGRPGMPGASHPPTPEPAPAPAFSPPLPPLPAPPPPPAPPPVFADSPLDGAFAIAQPEPEPGPENLRPGPGEATRPAEDSISLDSVFGEETLRMSAPAAEPPQAPAPAPEPASPATTAGFSFDQFFGPAAPTQAGAAAGAAGATAEPKGAPRTSSQKTRAIEEEGDLDQFQAWLRGLKS